MLWPQLFKKAEDETLLKTFPVYFTYTGRKIAKTFPINDVTDHRLQIKRYDRFLSAGFSLLISGA